MRARLVVASLLLAGLTGGIAFSCGLEKRLTQSEDEVDEAGPSALDAPTDPQGNEAALAGGEPAGGLDVGKTGENPCTGVPSCSLPASFICNAYHGAAWTAESVAAECTADGAEARAGGCPTESLLGCCFNPATAELGLATAYYGGSGSPYDAPAVAALKQICFEAGNTWWGP